MQKTPILVVSSEPSIRVLIRQTLTEPKGFQVDFSADAIDGLAVVNERYRMALVEFDMAEMNGLEFLQQVRMGRSDVRRNLPVGILSGFADHKVLSAAIALDVSTLLLRPLSARDILKRVAHMLTDTVQLKHPETYEGVEIPAGDQQRVSAMHKGRSGPTVLMPRQPADARAAVARTSARQGPIVDDASFGPMRRRSIKELRVGWQIGQDIVGQSGTRLVGAGTIVTQRLLTRLLDLVDQGDLTDAWVRAPQPLEH